MRGIQAFAAGAALALALAGPAAAQSPTKRAGDVRAIVPTGFLRSGTAPEKEVQRNDVVKWQDVTRTARRGRMRIVLDDGSILNVGSESQLTIVQHDAATQQTDLELSYGRLRSTVTRLAKPGAGFRVRTPVANAGVVGTRFIVRSSGDVTEVFCLEGEVSVRNSDPAVPGEVTLHPGEFTRVVRGQPPAPPSPASPELTREAEDETDIPPGPLTLSRVEISWPPAGCGDDAQLTVRGWAQEMRDGKSVEVPVDPELISSRLRLGAQTVAVEGGRAFLRGGTSGEVPQAEFSPTGQASPVATKLWPPLKTAAGEGWRSPRAVFAGSAFYVLGPMGTAGRPEFSFNGQNAALLWQSPCGAGFLAPPIPGREYDVTLSLAGTPAATGKMNLIDVGYRMPVPPALLRGQQTSFGVNLRGLANLDRFTQGRPVMIVLLTNQTPMILGALNTRTPGGTATGQTITFRVDRRNIDATGGARLDGGGRGPQAGTFVLGVDFKLDPLLEEPRTPLTPAKPPT